MRRDQRLLAYYYGFDATDVPEIDEILAAVAGAGHAYHNTEDWTEGTPSEADRIQAAANAAAEAFRQLRKAKP
jgi:hypothetical protein